MIIGSGDCSGSLGVRAYIRVNTAGLVPGDLDNSSVLDVGDEATMLTTQKAKKAVLRDGHFVSSFLQSRYTRLKQIFFIAYMFKQSQLFGDSKSYSS